MKTRRSAAGLFGLLFLVLFSGLLKAETDREMLVKRWKVVKHQKSGKGMPLTEDDFIQFRSDGVYEHARNRYYAKGSWAVIADELTINNNGEHKWKIVAVSEEKMSLTKGTDETMELEVVEMPAAVDKTRSQKMQYLCSGKWRPNEHRKGETVMKFQATDIIAFYSDGTYEKIVNGVYSRDRWIFNKEETELTIDGVVWKIENLSALFFKISKASDVGEFMIFAHTR